MQKTYQDRGGGGGGGGGGQSYGGDCITMQSGKKIRNSQETYQDIDIEVVVVVRVLEATVDRGN